MPVEGAGAVLIAQHAATLRSGLGGTVRDLDSRYRDVLATLEAVTGTDFPRPVRPCAEHDRNRSERAMSRGHAGRDRAATFGG